jgi:hypothetical protein
MVKALLASRTFARDGQTALSMTNFDVVALLQRCTNSSQAAVSKGLFPSKAVWCIV